MGSSLLEQAPIAARAVATRLRLKSLMRDSSLPELLRALSPATDPDPLDVVPLALVEAALSTSQRIVGRLRVVPDTCLYRSLARYALLRRAGHPVRFVMALDPKKEVEGHAWLELDGVPLGEEIEPGLAVTFSYPPASTRSASS